MKPLVASTLPLTKFPRVYGRYRYLFVSLALATRSWIKYEDSSFWTTSSLGALFIILYVRMIWQWFLEFWPLEVYFANMPPSQLHANDHGEYVESYLKLDWPLFVTSILLKE